MTLLKDNPSLEGADTPSISSIQEEVEKIRNLLKSLSPDKKFLDNYEICIQIDDRLKEIESTVTRLELQELNHDGHSRLL
jgi:hypothetical protein